MKASYTYLYGTFYPQIKEDRLRTHTTAPIKQSLEQYTDSKAQMSLAGASTLLKCSSDFSWLLKEMTESENLRGEAERSTGRLLWPQKARSPRVLGRGRGTNCNFKLLLDLSGRAEERNWGKSATCEEIWWLRSEDAEATILPVTTMIHRLMQYSLTWKARVSLWHLIATFVVKHTNIRAAFHWVEPSRASLRLAPVRLCFWHGKSCTICLAIVRSELSVRTVFSRFGRYFLPLLKMVNDSVFFCNSS